MLAHPLLAALPGGRLDIVDTLPPERLNTSAKRLAPKASPD